MKSAQELATRIDAPFVSTQARRKQFTFKYRWLLLSLIVWASATSSGYAQAWKYHPKTSWQYHPIDFTYHPRKSWKYHPQTSWEYHPKTSWTYHPVQERQVRVRRVSDKKNGNRITCANPLIAEFVAQVSGDRAQVESFDIDCGRLLAGLIPYPLRAGMVFLMSLDEHAVG